MTWLHNNQFVNSSDTTINWRWISNKTCIAMTQHSAGVVAQQKKFHLYGWCSPCGGSWALRWLRRVMFVLLLLALFLFCACLVCMEESWKKYCVNESGLVEIVLVVVMRGCSNGDSKWRFGRRVPTACWTLITLIGTATVHYHCWNEMLLLKLIKKHHVKS